MIPYPLSGNFLVFITSSILFRKKSILSKVALISPFEVLVNTLAATNHVPEACETGFPVSEDNTEANSFIVSFFANESL